MGKNGANVAQSVERIHGKDEVVGSIPTVGSKNSNNLLKIVENRHVPVSVLLT